MSLSLRALVILALLLVVVGATAGPGVRPVVAADACPEPNGDPATACFLGVASPVTGFLDSPDDVDIYRIELPADSMIVATLESRPADYGLRVVAGDGSVIGEAAEAGPARKFVRADDLPAGAYFLEVFSRSGESSADQPYLLGVAYPASLMLGRPDVPPSPPGLYVPGPPSAYLPRPDEVGPGFREYARLDSRNHRTAFAVLLAPDVEIGERTPLSYSHADVTFVAIQIQVGWFGADDELSAAIGGMLDGWRADGLNVEPAVGWGSEEVFSYARAGQTHDGLPTMSRGILLRHHNAIAEVQVRGLARYTTWDRLSGLMRLIEQRIHAALAEQRAGERGTR